MLGTARIIWPYEDEDDIEEILPFALALVVFDGSIAEVVLPGRFRLVSWMWRWSDWFTVGQADLLSGTSAIGKRELASGMGIILYLLNTLFCVLALACDVDKSGIAAMRAEGGRGPRASVSASRMLASTEGRCPPQLICKWNCVAWNCVAWNCVPIHVDINRLVRWGTCAVDSPVAVRGLVRVPCGELKVRCSDAGADFEAQASWSPTRASTRRGGS